MSNFNGDANKELESYTMSVGISFVNAYYKQLGEDPAGLASFFAADSAFTWSDDENTSEAVGTTSFGRDAIAQRLKQLPLEGAQVRINSVTCQPSANHAVLVQVVGEISPNASDAKKSYNFVQVFYLVKVAHKFRYYCYNDSFRYLSAIKEEETAKVEEPEFIKPQQASQQPAAPASPQRHEGTILGGSDPIAPTSHSSASAGVIGPASSSSAAASAPTSAPKEEASPVNLSSQFSGAGAYGAIGQSYPQAEQPTTNDWAEEESEPVVEEPEPTPAPVATPAVAPAKQPEPQQAAPAPSAKKGWATVEKPQAVPIQQQQQQKPQQKASPAAQQAAAPVQDDSDDDNGKPLSFLEAIKRKQRKAAQAAGPVTVSAPATAAKKQDDSAGGRAKLAQERKEYEAREAAARRPREQPERRPRQETPRFGVFVGKMPSEATEKDVIEVFSTFGQVASVRIPQGKRVAFVDFADANGRNAAITAGKASVIGQQVVITEPQATPTQGGQGGQSQGDRKGGQSGDRKGQQGSGQGGQRPKAGSKAAAAATGKQ